jgi:hypothetical protein
MAEAPLRLNTDATRKLLATVWEKNLPVVRERVEQLASIVALAQAGVLDSVQREAGIATAHKLSGSLGMFGYAEGTDAARAIEQGLDAETLDTTTLTNELAKLRSALPL